MTVKELKEQLMEMPDNLEVRAKGRILVNDVDHVTLSKELAIRWNMPIEFVDIGMI